MEFDRVVRLRRSVRSYSSRPVPEQYITQILDAADMAPSAGGLKARAFFIARSQQLRQWLARAALDQEFIAEAPVVLIFCADLDAISEYGQRGQELYCIQDTSAAVQNALLKAVDLGLGACWVGAFEEEDVSRVCRLPRHLRPVALVSVGFESVPGSDQ